MSEIETSAMSADDARRLTERIRLIAQNVADNVEKLRELVAAARESNVHEVLGYASWTAYLKDVFGDEPLRLARDVRQELVAELASQGMSTRAIAPIVGVSKSLVADDIAEVSRTGQLPTSPPIVADLSTGEVIDAVTEVTEAHTVRTVTGLDGKTYQPVQPKKPNRRALTDTARDAGWELRKAVERIERIREDDRFSRNKDEVATHLRSHLMHTIETCQGILDELNQSQED